jgi:uncharacterized protein (TIGR02246 family)
MSFRDTLGRHLLAIHERDLKSLADTLAEDLVLVTSDGKLVNGSKAFLDLHRDWFGMKNWTLDAKPVQIWESADLGIAVLRLVYREPPAVHQESTLTLAFQRRAGRWLMVLDQNTPSKQ